MRCIKHWLLFGFSFTIDGAAAAKDEGDVPRLKVGDGVGQNTNSETFLGACPEYGQYASHKQ